MSDVTTEGLWGRKLGLGEKEDPNSDGCGPQRGADVSDRHPSVGGLGLGGVGIGVLVKVGACDAVSGLLSDRILVGEISCGVAGGCEDTEGDPADQHGPTEDPFCGESGLLLTPRLVTGFGDQIEVDRLGGFGLDKDLFLKDLVAKTADMEQKIAIRNKDREGGCSAIALFDEDLCARWRGGDGDLCGRTGIREGEFFGEGDLEGASKGQRVGVVDIERIRAGREFDDPLLADVSERFKEGGSTQKQTGFGVFGGDLNEAFAREGRKAVVIGFEGRELERAYDRGRVGVDHGGLIAACGEIPCPCIGDLAAFGSGGGFDAELGFCVVRGESEFGEVVAFLESVVFGLGGALAVLVFKEGFIEVAVKEL